MKPAKGTYEYLLLARASSRAAQLNARIGRWEKAAQLASRAGDYMKKVKWELGQ